MSCLETTMKAKVNDNSLKFYGAISLNFDVPSGATQTIQFVGSTPVILHFFDGREDVELSGTSKSYLFGEGAYKVLVYSKYTNCVATLSSVGNISYMSLDVEDIKYYIGEYNAINFVCLKTGNALKGLVGDVANMPSSTFVTKVNLQYNNNLVGDLNDLVPKYPNATNYRLDGCDVDQDINAFNSLTSLLSVFFNQSKVHGELKDFVFAQRTAGRTSVPSTSPITLNYLSPSVTIFGNALTTQTTNSIYWDADTITLKNGNVTTIYNNNGDVIG